MKAVEKTSDGVETGRIGAPSAAPDGATGHTSAMPTNVIQAIARVMAELPGIGKNDQASPQQGGYSYRGIEAITAETQKLCGRYCVVLVPKVVERRTVELVVNGKPWTEEQLAIVYTVYGPGGIEDRIEVGPLWGLGRDNSDKGSNKALTQAYKYALVQVFQIGDSKSDGDSESAQADAHPTSNGAPADPEAWFREQGWTGRAEEVAWRQSYTAMAATIAADDRAQFKADAEGMGLVWSQAIPKPVADEVDKLLAMYLAPVGNPQTHDKAEAGRKCDGCNYPIAEDGSCACPF